MEELMNIATYFICKGISTSQTMGRWLPLLDFQKGTSEYGFLEWLKEFHIRVRDLREKRLLTEQIATYLLQYSLWRDEAVAFLQKIEQQGVIALLWNSPLMPQNLRNIPDFPTILFLYGKVPLLNETNVVTLVGTRNPSQYALMKTKQLVFEAIGCHFITVSGLADGIDTQVMRSTLEYGGNSIAILPQLNSSIIERFKTRIDSVLLISEFPPMEKDISKWQYIARNRLLAGISDMTIVLEAPLKSGTLHTADFAQTYNKNLSVLLPLDVRNGAYGGICLAQSLAPGVYIQSLYDAFWASENFEAITQFKNFIYLLSGGYIDMPDNDARHLASIDLKQQIYRQCQENLVVFQKVVVSLVQFGIIIERKGVIKFNFSGFNKWPKISLL